MKEPDTRSQILQTFFKHLRTHLHSTCNETYPRLQDLVGLLELVPLPLRLLQPGLEGVELLL